MFRRRFLKTFGHSPDYTIIGVALFLVAVGLLFLASASSDIGKIRYDDAFHFLKSQVLRGILPGILGFLVGYFVYYRRWKKLAPFLLLLNLFLLVLVFTPIGIEANGAHRWVDIGGISFQPSEFLKFTFIIYLASLLSSSRLRSQKRDWETYWLFLFVCALIAGLIIVQPATTMAIIILLAGAIMYLFNGAPLKQILLTVVLAFLGVALLVFITPYRLYRVAPFWNSTVGVLIPSVQLESQNVDHFHVDQSRIAIGTGGLWGVGFGKSTTKYSVLPEPMGDSIFAVIAEEMGFVGGVAVLAAYLVFFWRSTALVKRSHDDFAKLMVLGFASIITVQAIIHIAANSGLLPFTGIPLPLISYGGSSLTILMLIIGVIANVSRHTSYSR